MTGRLAGKVALIWQKHDEVRTREPDAHVRSDIEWMSVRKLPQSA
jgi:hypothetical protein